MQLQQTFNRLDAKFQLLDRLPESLYHPIVTHTHGSLKQRIEGILQWRDYLLAGELPELALLAWPEPDIALVVLKRLEALEIVKYCQDQEELTDSILLDICEAISSVEAFNELDPGFDDRLAQEQKQRDRDSPFDDPRNESSNQNSNNKGENIDDSEGGTEFNSEISPENNPYQELSNTQSTSTQVPEDNPENEFFDLNNDLISKSQFPVQHTADNEPTYSDKHYIDQYLENNWQQLAQNWDSLAAVYTELGGFLGRGWDLTQGLLASQGWKDIEKYQQNLQNLPQITKIIASIGRCRERQGHEKSHTEAIMQPIKRIIEKETPIQTPNVIMHTSGIKQSDDISRLLASEAALLGNSQLKMLWQAKRAERTLLTYEIDGVLSQHEPIEIEDLETIQEEKESINQGYGPILVCLDTSASMHGELENTAKAITLEAFRIALEENRGCYLFLFGGPEQVIQYDLNCSKSGLSDLLNFISQSFHGGTDILGPLLMALEKVQERDWEKADILLLSDGRFPVMEQQKQKIQWARRNNECRIHGVQLGDWRGEGMGEFCDFIHYI